MEVTGKFLGPEDIGVLFSFFFEIILMFGTLGVSFTILHSCWLLGAEIDTFASICT